MKRVEGSHSAIRTALAVRTSIAGIICSIFLGASGFKHLVFIH